MAFEGLRIGFAMTGSFCTFSKVLTELEKLKEENADIVPIMSEMVWNTDTRFGNAADFIDKVKKITGREIIHSIKSAEPIGPKKLLDALVIAPCTGNTLAKMANGITDSCVVMAAKASLRNCNPVVIAVSTNDGLSASARNIATLLNRNNVYFVPFGQDDPTGKPDSLVADMSKIPDTLSAALEGRRLQPQIISHK